MRLGAILLVLALGVPNAAFGNPREFNRLVNKAERAYEARQYKESAEALIEAYAYKPHPNLIYNIARAYDQAGELELALEYYQRYVGSQEGTNATLLKRSSLSIDRLRGLMAQQQETKEKEAEEQARLAAEAKAAQERAAQEEEAKLRAEKELSARKQVAAETRSRNRILAYSFGGLAVAGLGAGTFFGLSANGSKSSFNGAETVTDKERFEQQTRSNALIADIGFGVGIAAAITAVLLYPKGEDEAPQKPRAMIIPSAGGAGMLVRF